MFTVDLEDNDGIAKLKVNKDNKTKKISKDQIKTVYATMGALQVTDADIADELQKMGYARVNDAKPDDTNKIIEKIKEIARARREKDSNAKPKAKEQK